MRTWISTLVVIAMLVTMAPPAFAACSGSSPNLTAATWNDVAACYTAAVSGDTITVTPGGYTVTATTAFATTSKYVTLIGTGVTLTYNFSTDDLLKVTESTAGSTRVQGFTFIRGASAPPSGSAIGAIRLKYTVGGKPILVTGNTCTFTDTGDCIHSETNRGVIWANVATGIPGGGNCNNNASFVRHKSGVITDSWTTASMYGADDTNGDQNLYVEGNTVTDVGEAIDVDDNARIVIRYNTWINAATSHHGNDTSGTGARYSEIYRNTYVWDSSDKCAALGPGIPTNQTTFIGIRGGTSLIHHNVIPDMTSAAWGDKKEVKFSADNLRRNDGPYACYLGGWPIPHQIGRGANEISEPTYIWGNTGAGNYATPEITNYVCDDPSVKGSCDYPNQAACNARDSAATYIVAGRDYKLEAKPGYTEFTYPHPLTGSTPLPPPPAEATTLGGGVTIRGGATIR